MFQQRAAGRGRLGNALLYATLHREIMGLDSIILTVMGSMVLNHVAIFSSFFACDDQWCKGDSGMPSKEFLILPP